MSKETIVGTTDEKRIIYNSYSKAVEQYLPFDEAEKRLIKEEAARAEKQKASEKSPYFAFVQLNKEPYILYLTKHYQTASMILHFFIWKMDRMNEVSVKRATIMEALEISEATVDRALRYLKSTKCISVVKDDNINTYIVNPYIAWYNYGDRVQYCRFDNLQPPKLENPFKNICRLYISKGVLRIKKAK